MRGMRIERASDLQELSTRVHQLAAAPPAACLLLVPGTALEAVTRLLTPLPGVVAGGSGSPHGDRQGNGAGGWAVPAAVVAVLPDRSAQAHLAVVYAGALGVVHDRMSLGEVLTVLSSAARGFTVVPRHVARAMCRPLPEGQEGQAPRVSSEERGWLIHLARGGAVAELVAHSGRPERELYRMLAALYRRLGAAGRNEALIAAQRAGLLY